MDLPENHSCHKLARALRLAGLEGMAVQAEQGYYHDFLSQLTFPCHQLLEDLRVAERNGNLAATALIARHLNGDFDATPEESEEWANSRDGQEAMSGLTAELKDKLFGVRSRN